MTASLDANPSTGPDDGVNGTCRLCFGFTWPARLDAACSCLLPCAAAECTGHDTSIPPAPDSPPAPRPRPAPPPTAAGAPDRWADSVANLNVGDAARLARLGSRELTRMSKAGLAPRRRGQLGWYVRAELEEWIAGWSA